jgi:hypothetical protein
MLVERYVPCSNVRCILENRIIGLLFSTYNPTATVGNACNNGAHNLNPPVELLGYSISSESQVRVSIQACCCKSCGHWYDVNNTEVIIQ